MEPAPRRLGPRQSAALALLVIAIALAAVGRDGLARLVPLQAVLLEWLMPEFRLDRVALETGDGQLRLAVRVVTIDYLVLHGHAYPPGYVFEAHTPARQTSRRLAVLVAVAALLLWVRARTPVRAWIALATSGTLLALAALPVILAGQMWALVVAAWSEPSGRALLVWASEFLLHGGDVALAAALAMVLSDHGRPWSGRTMIDASDEGAEQGPRAAR